MNIVSFLKKKRPFKSKVKYISYENDTTTRYNVIFIVGSVNYGDTARLVVQKANDLIAQNVGVSIITSEITMQRFLKPQVNIILLDVCSTKLFARKRNTKIIKKIIKSKNPDEVHIFSIFSAWSSYYAVKSINKKRAKKHLSPIKTILYITKIWDISSYFRKRLVSIVEKVDKIVIMSEQAKDFVLDNYNVDINKMFFENLIIDKNSMDFEKITENRIADAAKQIGVSNCYNKIIIIPCRYHEDKGLIDLLYKFNKPYFKSLLNTKLDIDDNDKYIFVFIGDFHNTLEYRKEMQKHIDKLELNEKVKLIDKIDDMPAVYSLASGVIFCQNKPDAFNFALLEVISNKKNLLIMSKNDSMSYYLR